MTKRIHYRAALALVNAKLGTMVKGTYDKETSTIEVEYQEGPEAASVIHNAFSHNPAKVQPEVKAEEAKKEIVEETEMSEKTYTKAEVDAIVKYLKDSMSVKEVVKTVYPADYETLKKTSASWQSKYTEAAKELAELQKKYDKLVSEMKEAKPVEKKDTLVKAINEPMTEEEVAAFNFPEKVIPSKKEETASVTADFDDSDKSYYSEEDDDVPFVQSTLPTEVTGRKEEVENPDRKDAKYLLDEEGYGYKYITDDNFVENLQKANNTQKFGLNYFVYEFQRYTEATGRKVNNVYDAVLAIAKQAETMKDHAEKTFSFMIDRFCTAKNQTHFGVVLYTTPELRALLHDLDLANAKALSNAKLGL